MQLTVARIPWHSNLALAEYTKPIGVAECERHITESLPKNLKSSLPTIEEIEAEFSEEENDEWAIIAGSSWLELETAMNKLIKLTKKEK